MRRVTASALVLIALGLVVVGSAFASNLNAMWMSLTPEGPAQTDFPSGTQTVYVVFEYTDFVSEHVRVVVTDYTGSTVFLATRTFSGSGVGSVSIAYGQSAFPDGPYVTTLYFAGQYLTRAVEWTVGGVDSPPTPTVFPPARLEVEPATLTFGALQGGVNPSAQRVLVSNNTASASVWRATANAPWLRLVPEGGETPALLRISVDGTGLPAGTYTGRVVISADEIEGSPHTVGVTLTISQPDNTTTLDVPTASDGTGWVVSDEAVGNHFGEGEIRVGLQAGRELQGGLQFDLSEIPVGSDIRAAAVILRGLRWEIQPSAGEWVLELIDGDLAQGWAGRAFPDIANAAVHVALTPAHDVSDLGPSSESVWHLDSTGLDVLESLVRDSDVSVMRLRYVPSPAQPSGLNADVQNGLFVWDASGVLRVNYEPDSGSIELATVTPVQTSTAVSPTATPFVPPPPPGGRQPLMISVADLAWALALLSVLHVFQRAIK